ncbi:hypothetical protein C8J57DRAFT_1390705 [Mycena rebaudengoi]|nr:hypothetical protein C8J57DRAFT_1390705 [Mycena rebaudengoi]
MSQFDNCDAFYDKQLLMDTMAGSRNSTFTFECYGGTLGSHIQPGPTFKDCSDPTFFNGNFPYTNFCIGGMKQQHACSAGRCQAVDWTGAISSPCSSVVLDYAQAQPNGMASPCCNPDGCSTPSTKFNCGSIPSSSLQLCILDGASLQCVDPASSAICSGKYSTDALLPSDSTRNSPSGLPTDTTSTSTDTSSHGHSSFSTTDTIAVATSLVGALAAVVTIVGGIYGFKKWKETGDRKKRLTISERPSL